MIHLRDDPSRAPTHDELLRQAAQYLEYRGFLAVITHDAKHRPCTPGVFDLLALAPGSIIVDAKTGRDKLQPEQQDFADRAIRCGIHVHELRSIDDLVAIAHRL